MKKYKELLLKASYEITSLRKSNDRMQAQLAIVDVFAAALGLRKESQGMSVDVVWEIDKFLESEKEE